MVRLVQYRGSLDASGHVDASVSEVRGYAAHAGLLLMQADLWGLLSMNCRYR